jgi:hypothetical protein
LTTYYLVVTLTPVPILLFCGEVIVFRFGGTPKLFSVLDLSREAENGEKNIPKRNRPSVGHEY